MARKANYIEVPKSERKAVPGARLICPCHPDERMQVTVHVRRRGAQNSAHSVPPRNLTHKALEQRYGADPMDLAKVEEFAKHHGLVVVESSTAKRVVKLSGTVKAFEEAFDVSLGHYEHPHFTYRGRVGSIGIPRELQGIIVGVLGLDNRPFARPHCVVHKPRPTGVTSHAADQPQGLSPVSVANLYGFPPGDGTGQTVGIIELGGGFRPQDLKVYFDGLRISPTPTVRAFPTSLNQPGSLQQPNGANVEVMLDIEIVGAIVPKATIVVYFAPDASDDSFVNVFHDAVHDTVNNPAVISISWGGPEDGPPGQFIEAFQAALEDAQSLNITVLVASGDNGAADMQPVATDEAPGWDGKAHVDFPSSSPLVLACGATHINPSGTTLDGESAWNQGISDDPQDDSFRSVGGGISDLALFMPPPAWQANINLPPNANGTPPGRGVPDVTGDGDPSSGYGIRVDGRPATVGGTSAVAPLWAGLITRINQAIGGRVGFVNATLYANPQAFNDITLGNNRVSSAGGNENLGYDATPGWDACTGLGSPKGQQVLSVLSPRNG